MKAIATNDTVKCKHCGGTGDIPGSPSTSMVADCPKCDGLGYTAKPYVPYKYMDDYARELRDSVLQEIFLDKYREYSSYTTNEGLIEISEKASDYGCPPCSIDVAFHEAWGVARVFLDNCAKYTEKEQ